MWKNGRKKRKIEAPQIECFHEKIFKCPQKDSISKIEESKVSSENRNSDSFLSLGASECGENVIFDLVLGVNMERTFAPIWTNEVVTSRL